MAVPFRSAAFVRAAASRLPMLRTAALAAVALVGAAAAHAATSWADGTDATTTTAAADPLVAFLSPGDTGRRVDDRFNPTPTLFGSGSGALGGCGTCLFVDGNAAGSTEAHGAVPFKGNFSELNGTVPKAEHRPGFAVGAMPVTAAPEPSIYAQLACGLAVGGFMAGRRRVGPFDPA